MIVVDTSAIIAIDLREPNYQLVMARLMSRQQRYIPATVVLEATVILSRVHPDPKFVFESYVSKFGLTITPIDAAIAAAAQEAFLKFGKGRHPAKLNLCDCFSYAVAKVLNMPLLFVGNDFPQTDIQTV